MGKDGVMSNSIHFPFSRSTLKQLQYLKNYPVERAHLEAFPQFYTAYDIFQPFLKIKRLSYDDKTQTAVFRFSIMCTMKPVMIDFMKIPMVSTEYFSDWRARIAENVT